MGTFEGGPRRRPGDRHGFAAARTPNTTAVSFRARRFAFTSVPVGDWLTWLADSRIGGIWPTT